MLVSPAYSGYQAPSVTVASTLQKRKNDSAVLIVPVVSGEDEDELRGYWEKLSAGGAVAMPLEQAPWGDTFGMCTDKFGVSWMVNIAGAPPGS